MKYINKKILIEMMRYRYRAVLESYALGEVDIYDKEGNLLLTPDLKVTHKDSGYEYTVDKVDDDGNVYLRSPESPRFEPLGAGPKVISDDTQEFLGEDDLRQTLHDLIGQEEEIADEQIEVSDDVIFVVDKKDFEKEYIVK